MDSFTKKTKVAPAPLPTQPRMQQRRKSLIEDYYAWRHNEFEAALEDAAKKEAMHHTPPPSPVYERRVALIDGKSYEKNQRKKLLEEVGDHSLDIFKPHKQKKFTMYPVVPHTPDETPCMSPCMTPNLSSASFSSSHHHDHHTSFPHLPDINESENEDDDTPTKPMVFNFKSNSSLNKNSKGNGVECNRTELEKMMERKLLPNDPNKPDLPSVVRKKAPSAPQSSSRRAVSEKNKKAQEVDLERNRIRQMKYSKWEIAQEFVPWVMIVTSIIQIALFMADRDEFFQLLVFAPKHTIELWRFVTYIFLHTNFTHLALNVVIQILLAIPLEFEQNHGRVAAVYFGGSVLGACGVMLFGPKILVVGASAGVYSLLLSHIPHIILNKRTIRYRNVRLGGVLFLCFCDLVHTVVHFSTTGNSEPKIGVWAHVFGAVGGLLLGMVLYTFIDPEDGLPEHRHKYYVKLRRGSIAALALIIISTFVYGMWG